MTAEVSPSNSSNGSRHIEAIDGLRAVAVAAVLIFHADLGIAPGGFLGVSLFFTLSGYLITTLLLREHQARGTISIRGFYGRRWRRLVPSAWLCIAVALAATPLWSDPQVRALPGDALAALGQVANWRAAFAGLSYQDLFIGKPSPLAHFWSLAIEEQFYAVMPLLALLALRRSRRTLSLVVWALLAGSVVATMLTSDRDLIYNGTHTRAAELLVGVLLAIHAPALRGIVRQVIGWIALAAFGVVVALASISDTWLYRGGLAGFSVISAALVLAVIGPERSYLTAVLATRPLVAIGRWSYALYLIHWPIYLAMSKARTGLRPLPLFAARTALALALAALITVAVERPIRTRRILAGARRTVLASLVAAMSLVIAVVVLPRPALSENDRLLAAGEAGQIVFGDAPHDSVDHVTTTTAPPVPVLVVGSDAAVPAALRSHGLAVIDDTNQDCPLVQGVNSLLPTGEIVSIAGCTDATARWVAMADADHVNDVVIAFGAIDDGLIRAADDVGFPAADNWAEQGRRWKRLLDKVRLVWDSFPTNVHLHLLYSVEDGRWLVDELRRYAAENSRLSSLHSSIESLVSELTTTANDSPQQRVLVVGDSTSVILAEALNRAADGSLEVRWVGANGCPFVDVTWLRSSAKEDWGPSFCNSMIDLVSKQLAVFTPDIVIVMVTIGELRHQKYPGDHHEYVAGDPGYIAAHDAYMQRFAALFAESGTAILVADCPNLREGSGAMNKEMASADRIAAWNAQVQRWADSSPDIAVLPYAAAISEYESTIGEALVDGTHADVNILTEIIRTQLLDVIRAAAAG